jgi:cyclic di-GMP phosphodiesterase
MSIKKIPIESLRLGMFIVKLDRSWLETPFFSHRFLVKKISQLTKIKASGVRYVEIDTEQGLDDIQPQSEELSESPTADPTIHLEEELAKLPSDSEGRALSIDFHQARDLRKEMLGEVQEVLSNVRTSGVVDGEKAKEVAEDIITRTIGHEEALAALIRTREFSPDLYDHSLSVCTISVLLGRLLGYEKHLLHQLAMGALLHDIGLLQLPANVVRPRRLLSETEEQLYHQHPDLGVEILKKSEGISQEVIEMIALHHQSTFASMQENGCPAELNTASRVLRVVDAYDELLTGQGQKKPLPVKDALSELYQQGQRNELDLNLVSHLINQIGIYPIYSLVELNTGERGIITAITPGQLLNPVVLVIQDPNHRPYENPIPINFSARMPEESTLQITEVLDAEKEGVSVEEVLADWVAL